jgi:hypothetical protein
MQEKIEEALREFNAILDYFSDAAKIRSASPYLSMERKVIMERSFDEEIKNSTVNADDVIWQEFKDQLFLAAMSVITAVTVI